MKFFFWERTLKGVAAKLPRLYRISGFPSLLLFKKGLTFLKCLRWGTTRWEGRELTTNKRIYKKHNQL